MGISARVTRSMACSLIVLATVLGCGGEKLPQVATWAPRENPTAPDVTLVLFGAFWCTTCSSEFPKIQELLNQLPEEDRARVAVELYVPTGIKPAEPPTEEIASAYQKKVHVDGVAAMDDWKKKDSRFQTFVGRPNLGLPGAAILGSDGQLLHKFQAGGTTFVPAEIVGFVQRELP